MKQHEKEVEKNSSSFTRFILSSGVFCLFCSVGFYMVSVNTLATKGYEIRLVEKRIAESSEIYKQMRVEEAQLTSLYRVRRVSEDLLLEDVENEEFVYGIERFAFSD
ncbi:MAG: hypothetical protein EOM19_01775 [Candidatus Moranbacteria bacterium]|nr:hypothetical protein [Candidatus Moranbacteria bacterium]